MCFGIFAALALALDCPEDVPGGFALRFRSADGARCVRSCGDDAFDVYTGDDS